MNQYRYVIELRFLSRDDSGANELAHRIGRAIADHAPRVIVVAGEFLEETKGEMLVMRRLWNR